MSGLPVGGVMSSSARTDRKGVHSEIKLIISGETPSNAPELYFWKMELEAKERLAAQPLREHECLRQALGRCRILV